MKIESGKAGVLKERFIGSLFVATVIALALAACGSGSGSGTSSNSASNTPNFSSPHYCCGGGGGGGTTGGGIGKLIGGTIQQKIPPLTGLVSIYAGSPSGAAGTTNATRTSALFNAPNGVTTDGTNLYVADQINSQIRQIVIATGVVTLLAGSPTGVAGLTNGTGTAAQFNQPIGITCDGTNLYVADTGNNQIRKIVIATGVVTTLAGSATGLPGSTNATGTAALFNGPNAITTDGTNTNLYVADYSNNQIRQIVIATGVVTLFAGSPTQLPGTTNATGTAALFNKPAGIITDGTNLYVSDSGNNEIRQIVIGSGAVTLLAGSATGTAGLTNATGTAALFSTPHHITTDGTNLYVTEVGGNDVRQIVIATGVVTLLAGSATGASGLTNGAGTLAQFNKPAGITSDGTSLYVGDLGNNEIRQIQ